MVGVQRQFMITMFGDGAVVGAHDGRYNVLLLGGDSGAGRWGLRPDSLTVASIDAEHRQDGADRRCRATWPNFPFAEGSVMDEQFPDGFDCDGLLPQRRQHLGRGPHRALRGLRQTPASTPP